MTKPLTLGDLKAAIAQAEKEGATDETPVQRDRFGRSVLYYCNGTAYLCNEW